MAGSPVRRAGCTRASTNVSEVTGPPTSIAAAIPLASTVFPAPSGPESTTTSPARNWLPSCAPSATVSSTCGSVAIPDLPSVTTPAPIAPTLTQHRESARGRVLDQPHQRVVDRRRPFQQHQMARLRDDHQLRFRQHLGNFPRIYGGGDQIVVAADDQCRDLCQRAQRRGFVVHLQSVEKLHHRRDWCFEYD